MQKQELKALCATLIIVISACVGKQKSEISQEKTVLQSVVADSIVAAVNDTSFTNEVFTEYDTVIIHNVAEKGPYDSACQAFIEIDTSAFPQLRFNCKDREGSFFMRDTIMNNRYIKYGNALSLDDRNRVIFYPLTWDSLKAENRVEDLKKCLLGNAICMMVDPIDGKDLIYLDRKRMLEILKLKRDTTYFASRIDQLGFGNLHFNGLKGDTIAFTSFFGMYDSDFGYVFDLKILKETTSTHLWVIDITDQIAFGD